MVTTILEALMYTGEDAQALLGLLWLIDNVENYVQQSTGAVSLGWSTTTVAYLRSF